MQAPWARQIADLLPVPTFLDGDVPLLLFGASAIVAGTTALVVLPETRGKLTPETVADAVASAGGGGGGKRRLTLEERKDAKRVEVATSVLGLLVASGVAVAFGAVMGISKSLIVTIRGHIADPISDVRKNRSFVR